MPTASDKVERVGPFKLTPEVERQRQEGLARSVATVLLIFGAFALVTVALVIWGIAPALESFFRHLG